MSPKYVVEAGTSQPVTSTPVPSPNPSISASESRATVTLVELGESTDESDLVEESASLLSTISRSKNLKKKGKGPEQRKGKRSKPVEDQDDKTDEELEKSESLFFKKKGGGQSNSNSESQRLVQNVILKLEKIKMVVVKPTMVKHPLRTKLVKCCGVYARDTYVTLPL